jgi:hypothetical protein
MSLDKLFPKASAGIKAALAANSEQYGEGLTFGMHQNELDKAVSHLLHSTINNDNSQDGTTHRVSASIRLLKVIEMEL